MISLDFWLTWWSIKDKEGLTKKQITKGYKISQVQQIQATAVKCYLLMAYVLITLSVHSSSDMKRASIASKVTWTWIGFELDSRYYHRIQTLSLSFRPFSDIASNNAWVARWGKQTTVFTKFLTSRCTNLFSWKRNWPEALRQPKQQEANQGVVVVVVQNAFQPQHIIPDCRAKLLSKASVRLLRIKPKKGRGELPKRKSQSLTWEVSMPAWSPTNSYVSSWISLNSEKERESIASRSCNVNTSV